MKKPKVSILCITYNQKDYIRQCIDGFLMQKTDFDFEILINDDASDDGTTEILKEYKAKHPDKIILNLQKENQYSKGIRNMIIRFLLPKAKSKYLALCEGDDYWTDPLKLQKQVDYMESHPDCTVCFHPVRVFFENKEKNDYIFPKTDNKDDFTFESLLTANFIQTNSVMYRKQKYENLATDVIPGDWYLHLYHAHFGKIGFINKVMSDYRRHSGGIWWGTIGDQTDFWKKNGIMHLNLYKRLLEAYGYDDSLKEIIMKNASKNTSSIVRADDSADNELVKKIAKDFPGYIGHCISEYTKEISRLNDIVTEKDKKIDLKNKENDDLQQQAARAKNEKFLILNSWSYKTGRLILFIPRAVKNFIKGFKK